MFRGAARGGSYRGCSCGQIPGHFRPDFAFLRPRQFRPDRLSMIPRAEIAMVIMQRSLDLQARPVPERIYSAMVMTCIATSVLSPLVLNRLIRRVIPSAA